MDHRQAAVAYQIGAIDEVAVVGWATEQLALDLYEHVRPVADLANANAGDRQEVRRLLREVLHVVDPSFIVSSAPGEQLARNVLAGALGEYLAGRASPYHVCRLVTPIESTFDFPSWLGGLYNVCDWIERETPRSEALGLNDEAERLLSVALGQVTSAFDTWIRDVLRMPIPTEVATLYFYMYEGISTFDGQLVGYEHTHPTDEEVARPTFTSGEELFRLDRLIAADSWKRALEITSELMSSYIIRGQHRSMLRSRAIYVGFVDGDIARLWPTSAA